MALDIDQASFLVQILLRILQIWEQLREWDSEKKVEGEEIEEAIGGWDGDGEVV